MKLYSPSPIKVKSNSSLYINELNDNPSKVDKWVGVLVGTSVSNAKKLRKEYIETKHK